ncbi:MAG: hypothetical protein HXO18_10775, partial [Prevotella shahii]|nr:hypothetical protein [Hoylesella shahii]
MQKIIHLLCLVFVVATTSAMAQQVSSPNGDVKVTFNLDNSTPTYAVA